MTSVRGLLFGAFITSCMLSFGLWINSQVNLNVQQVVAIPSKVEALSATSSTTTIVARNNAQLSQYIKEAPISYSNHSYDWTKPDTSLVIPMKSLIMNELGEYDSNYLKQVGLREIVLVGGLKNKAEAPVLGFTDPRLGTIYLNTLKVTAANSRAVVAEQTIHHEIAHLLSYKLYGYNFDREGQWSKSDKAFEYGRQNESMSEYFPRRGFVSRYSMYSPSEDFAEVYSLIYTNLFVGRLKEESRSSEVLKSKLSFVFDSISAVSPSQCRQSPELLEHVCDQ